MAYQITVSDHALEEMVLAASESFALGNARTWDSAEIQGYLWGSRRQDGDLEYIHVDRFSVSVSAWGDEDSVAVDDRVARLKDSVIELWAPHNHFLGTFHTHPYEGLDEVKGVEGWSFSEQDKEGLLDDEVLWALARPNHPIAMVMTVTKVAAVRFTHLKAEENLMEFNVGNLRFWLCVGIGGMSEGRTKIFSTENLRFHPFTRHINLPSSRLRGLEDE